MQIQSTSEFTSDDHPLKRGERNSNPCNIRYDGTNWKGLIGADDKGFCVFDSDHNGLRAGARDIHSKIIRDKLDTIEKFVPKFAPSNENDTEAYVRNVSEFTGFAPDVKINADAPRELSTVIKGVIREEQGRVIYTDEEILSAVQDALGVE